MGCIEEGMRNLFAAIVCPHGWDHIPIHMNIHGGNGRIIVEDFQGYAAGKQAHLHSIIILAEVPHERIQPYMRFKIGIVEPVDRFAAVLIHCGNIQGKIAVHLGREEAEAAVGIGVGAVQIVERGKEAVVNLIMQMADRDHHNAEVQHHDHSSQRFEKNRHNGS